MLEVQPPDMGLSEENEFFSSSPKLQSGGSPTVVELLNETDKLLTREFLSRYEGRRPANAGILFEVIYVRTYCRWLPDKNRRETWVESCQRVIEFSLSLIDGSNLSKRAEAEKAYDDLFNLRTFPAGRSLWIAGTAAGAKCPENNFNCAALVFDQIRCFVEIVHLLMGGSGVGFRILRDDVKQLPSFDISFSVEHEEYIPLPKEQRQEDTTVKFNGSEVSVVVGDTREGWEDALSVFLELVTNPLTYGSVIKFNYNHIRPAGEKLVSFGGFAAGHTPLLETLIGWDKVVKESGGTLRPIHILDMVTMSAENIAAGGTRSAALIALGDFEDKEFVHAKDGLYTDPAKRHLRHRSKSNNSVVFFSKPTREQIQHMVNTAKNGGEPGWINMEAGRKRRPDFETINPCGEILLPSRGCCNLSTTNLVAFVENGKMDFEELEKSIRSSTRICLRMTNVTLSMPDWDFIQKRDRLLGVDCTGWEDAFDALNWHSLSDEANDLRKKINTWANDEADKYSEILGVPRPVLVTTCKPNGTVSKLAGVSSGVHKSWSPYQICRVSVHKKDPLAKALIHLGVPYEEDKTKNKSAKIKFVFPIKSTAKTSSQEESVSQQFMRYIESQRNFADHNTSISILADKNTDEWDQLVDLIDEYWDEIVAISLFSKEDKENPYPQPPNEEITADEYWALKKDFPDLSSLPNLVNLIENLDAGLDDQECQGGVCPIR